MADNINVNVKVDTAEMRSQLAVAQAQLKSFNTEIKNLSTSMVATGQTGNAALNSALKSMTTDAAEAQSRVTTLSGSLKEATAATGGFHGSISTATREFRALFDELSSGRTRMIPGTLAIIGDRVFKLGPLALGSLGGIAALAAGLGYLAIKAYEASKAIETLGNISAFRGFAVTKTELEELTKQVEKLPHSTNEIATEVIAHFIKMKDGSVPIMRSMIDVLPAVADELGVKLPQAAKMFAEALGEPAKAGDQFLESLLGHTETARVTISKFDAEIAKGDVGAARKTMLLAITDATDRYEKANNTLTATERNRMKIAEGINAGMATEVGAFDAAVAATERLDKALDQISVDRAVKGAKDLTEAFKSVDLAPKSGAPLDAVRDQIAQMAAMNRGSQAEIYAAEVQTWQKRIDIGDLYGKQLTEAETARDRASVALKKAIGSEAIEATKLQISELQVNESLSADQRLATERNLLGQLIASGKLTADQRVQIEREQNTIIARLGAEEAKEHMKSLEATTDSFKKGSQERIVAAQAEVAFAVARWKEGSVEAIAAQKRVTQAQQEAVEITKKLAAEGAATQKTLGELQLANAKSIADDQYAAGQISATQRYTIEADLANKLYALQLAALELEKERYANDPVEYQKAADKVLIAAQKHENEMQTIQRQSLVAQRGDFQQYSSFLTTSMASAADGLIKGTTTWRQAELKVLDDVLSKFISYIGIRTGKYLGEMLFEETTSRVSELRKTAVMNAAQAQRTAVATAAATTRTASSLAADASQEESFLGSIARWIAGLLGFGAAQTTTDAARVVSGTSATAAIASESLIASFGMIMDYAAVAAAATIASISAIPFVGPALAPEAGAAQYALTLGYATGLGGGFATGAWNVPEDMLALIHRGEQIVPATYADDMRANVKRGPAQDQSSGGGDNYYVSINAIDTQSGAAFVKNHANTIVNALRTQVRNGTTLS